MTSITINQRFCGPPNSGNGGYTAGIIATNLPFNPEITLRVPPPLNTPLQLIAETTTASLMDNTTLVAEAKVTDLQLTVPKSITYEEAKTAVVSANAHQLSPLQTCFVCGSKRAEGDGLRIHSGSIGKNKVAAPWTPFTELGNEKGHVKTEFIWSALDCPGAWAIQDESQLFLLGRMAAKVVQPIRVKEKHVIMGWVIGQEGRKTWTGTAIYTEVGEVCAYAKGTWIAVKSVN
ncbi:MAG: hypothetical protein AAGJ18_05470 [Bacteroidota bacterium]